MLLTSCLALSALLPSASQGGCEVEHAVLGSSAQGLELWAPDGAAVLKGPFSLQVRGGKPGAPGVLGVAFAQGSTYLAPFDAVVHPALPALQLPFVLDGAGASAKLAPIGSLDPVLCGALVVAQGLALDPSATGGLAFSNGLRMVAGEVQGAYLPAAMTPLPGAEPADLVSGDFDLDGHADVAVRMVGTYSASILLGLGNGDFHPVAQPFFGAGTSVLRTADLDGDGALDLVDLQRTVEGWEVGALNTHLGHGDGTFAPKAIGELFYGVGMALVDLDLDGTLDVVAAEAPSGAPSVRTLLGNGDGTFQPGVPHATGLALRAVAAADFDLDGLPDVAAGGDQFAKLGVRLLRGNGDGTLDPEEVVLATTTVRALETADLDRNGAPDLVLGNGTVLLGAGTGAFSASTFPTGAFLSDLALLDLDGDGSTELVGLDRIESRALVLPGLPGGALGAPVAQPLGGDLPHLDAGLAVVDVDGDGARDLVAAPWYDQGADQAFFALEVHRGDGAGGFEAPRLDLGPSAFLAEALVAADLDGNGRADFASAGRLEVAVHLATPEAGFAPPASYPSQGFTDDVEAADLDGDGLVDLVLCNGFQSTVGTLRGGGGGAFEPVVLHAASRSPERLAVGDVDGDGAPDVVTAELAVYLGDGAGGLAPPAPLSGSADDVLLADLDLDGALDVVTAVTGASEARVLLGHGDGTFGAPTAVAVGAEPRAVAAGDVDLDGDPDVATANHGDETVSLLLGDGAGTLAPAPAQAVGHPPIGLDLVDVQGDGDLDAVVLFPEHVAILKGGPGAALGDVRYHAPLFLLQDFADLAVLDLSGDGIRDLLLIDHGGAAQLVTSSIGE